MDIIEFGPDTYNKATRVIQDGECIRTEIVEYEGRFVDQKAKWESKDCEVKGIGKG